MLQTAEAMSSFMTVVVKVTRTRLKIKPMSILVLGNVEKRLSLETIRVYFSMLCRCGDACLA